MLLSAGSFAGAGCTPSSVSTTLSLTTTPAWFKSCPRLGLRVNTVEFAETLTVTREMNSWTREEFLCHQTLWQAVGAYKQTPSLATENHVKKDCLELFNQNKILRVYFTECYYVPSIK